MYCVVECEAVQHNNVDCENNRDLNHGSEPRMVGFVSEFLPCFVTQKELYGVTHVYQDRGTDGEEEEDQVKPDTNKQALKLVRLNFSLTGSNSCVGIRDSTRIGCDRDP